MASKQGARSRWERAHGTEARGPRSVDDDSEEEDEFDEGFEDELDAEFGDEPEEPGPSTNGKQHPPLPPIGEEDIPF